MCGTVGLLATDRLSDITVDWILANSQQVDIHTYMIELMNYKIHDTCFQLVKSVHLLINVRNHETGAYEP